MRGVQFKTVVREFLTEKVAFQFKDSKEMKEGARLVSGRRQFSTEGLASAKALRLDRA